MGSESGIVNPRYPWVIFKKGRYARGIFAVGPHPAGQGLHSAMDQPAIEWCRHGASNRLHLADSLEEFAFFTGDDGTAKDIAVAAEIFRGRMHDEIGAEIERALDQGRPGIVAGQE